MVSSACVICVNTCCWSIHHATEVKRCSAGVLALWWSDTVPHSQLRAAWLNLACCNIFLQSVSIFTLVFLTFFILSLSGWQVLSWQDAASCLTSELKSLEATTKQSINSLFSLFFLNRSFSLSCWQCGQLPAPNSLLKNVTMV